MLAKLKKYWGDALLTFNHMGIMITLVNLCLLIITAYNTNWFQKHGLNVNIVGFAGIIIGILIVGMVAVKKINIPSFFVSWNEQFWGNKNPMKKEIDKMAREMIKQSDLENMKQEIIEELKKYVEYKE